ncbi:hypothetical protein Patl1_29108 [Pistacia atlantica]|uniref:Uncharacterized protein n=1 Tax=Pistacia atlantica TaxID=434234 RepID=A0ACC1BCZ6_9ROSI|nr:hypothetical protein Patl1_29108 [Pistacia atlantica]
MQDMDPQAPKPQIPNAQAPQKLIFLRGNEGLASMVEMDIDLRLPEKNANFVTRKHYLPVNCYGCGIRFDRRPATEDKIPASQQHFYFYNEKVYCSFACRQFQIDMEIPSLALKDYKDGACTSNAASATTPRKSNPRTQAPARRS